MNDQFHQDSGFYSNYDDDEDFEYDDDEYDPIQEWIDEEIQRQHDEMIEEMHRKMHEEQILRYSSEYRKKKSLGQLTTEEEQTYLWNMFVQRLAHNSSYPNNPIMMED